MFFWEGPQSAGGFLGGQISLGAGKKFVSHHKFSHHRGTQEWRIEMNVEMPLRMKRSIGGALMKAHRVRESRLKKIIVARRNLLENIRELVSLFTVQLI